MPPSEDEESRVPLLTPTIPSSPPYQYAKSGSIRSRISHPIAGDDDSQSVSEVSGHSLTNNMILKEPPMRKTFSALSALGLGFRHAIP